MKFCFYLSIIGRKEQNIASSGKFLLMFYVDDIFEPVTWHDHRRPFFPVLACKTGKTHRGLAGGASSDDQVSPVFM
jgi:hypothetical protein